MTIRRRLVVVIGVYALVVPLFSSAEEPRRVWRIGMLETTPRDLNAPNLEALRKGLRELGYVEGRNFIIHYRSVDGKPERFPGLANELVMEKVDLILTRGTPSTRAAMTATTTIPIVMTSVGDPVRNRIIQSLRRPGGNVTGLSAITSDLAGKRIELLREIFPGIKRIGFLGNMSNPNGQSAWETTEKAARSVGIQSEVLDVRNADDVRRLFELAHKNRLGAVLVVSDTVTQTNRRSIAEHAFIARLPTMASNSEFVAAGALMSYAGNPVDLYFHAASYIDKIFKGAKPGDLPVEEPAVMELALNLKTAKALGVVIPPSVQFRADKVIE